MTMILDGTAGVTFPVVAGSASAVQASSGRVLQVVNGFTTSSSSTTSTTYQQSLLTASITPSSATSKIFVLFTTTIVQASIANSAHVTIYRNNTTNLGGGTESSYSAYDNQLPSGYTWVPCAGNLLDSPSSTSSLSYTLYFKTPSTVTAVVNWATSKASITLMEIAA